MSIASMSMPLHAVFFDLDDTLCAARPAFSAGLEAAFELILAHRSNVFSAARRAAWVIVCANLFDQLESGTISMAEMRTLRFRMTLRRLGKQDDALSDAADLRLGLIQLESLRGCVCTMVSWSCWMRCVRAI